MRFPKFYISFVLLILEALSVRSVSLSLRANVAALQANQTASQNNQTFWQVNQTLPSNTLAQKPESKIIEPLDPQQSKLSEPHSGTPDPPSKLERDSDLSTREVTSKSFYTWRVTCPSWRLMESEMDPDPEHYPIIAGKRRPIIGSSQPGTRFAYFEQSCLQCRCTDDGELVVNLVVVNESRLSRKGRGVNRVVPKCRMPYVPEKCRVWFGCRCEVQMHNPKIEAGNSLTAYQEALNNIPWMVRIQNPGYRWKPVDRFSMGWRGTGPPVGGRYDAETTHRRELAPGTKEPYYLEGPDEVDPKGRDFEWATSPYTGIEGSLGSAGSGPGELWKRSSSGNSEGPEHADAHEASPTK
ncbi:hypothetical protein TWF718_006623 [Orbilia javanica]|uniref:Uncharacterized protein n=1 Tax=Orbilia javanica TaxID=47235 RepID=A0AAN8RHJ3_9PEZI